MAKLDITEYSSLATDRQGRTVMAGMEPKVTNQQVSIGASSTQSAAINSSTSIVRLHTDSACRVEIGADPTAAATSMRMAANSTEYLGIKPGLKIAVIATT